MRPLRFAGRKIKTTTELNFFFSVVSLPGSLEPEKAKERESSGGPELDLLTQSSDAKPVPVSLVMSFALCRGTQSLHSAGLFWKEQLRREGSCHAQAERSGAVGEKKKVNNTSNHRALGSGADSLRGRLRKVRAAGCDWHYLLPPDSLLPAGLCGDLDALHHSGSVLSFRHSSKSFELYTITLSIQDSVELVWALLCKCGP